MTTAPLIAPESSLPADQAVREQAISPEGSFLVEAPAGSGKTGLLIQRFLRLLASVKNPKAVVAITFTRKAAAEMEERIVEALRSAASEPAPADPYTLRTYQLARAVLTHDAELGWNLLENPASLQVQTIDSLCAMLTREMPLLSRFGGVPSVKEHAEELYRLAARRTLAALASGPAPQRQIFRNVVSHFESNLQTLEQQIAEMLAKRDQWLDLLERQPDLGRDLIERTLADSCLGTLARAHELWPESIPGRPALDVREKARFAQFAEMQLLKEKKAARRNKVHTVALDANPQFVEALDRCRPELPAELDETQWALIHDFLSMLVFSTVQLREIFEERGEVDFTEVTRAAIQALGTPEAPTDLSYRLDYRIEHLLIDEFQDTSVSQYKLVEALTREWSRGDNRTLFVVGDPMQSIYGFRQAEVRLFMEAAERGSLGQIPITRLRLTSNFRSTQAIVGWINQTMNAVLTDDPEYGGVGLRPSVAERPELGDAPSLQLFFDDESNQQEAAWITESIQSRLAAGGKDVAVLVRARTHVPAIIQLFQNHAIPYEAREIDELRGQQHILDVLSIAKAILHPADRLSWLACLRAPWCGLELADLSALAEGEPDRTILELLEDRERFGRLSVTGRERAARCGEILKQASLQAARVPIRRLVEASWLSLGGPACLTREFHREDVEVLFSLLDELDEGGAIRDFSILDQRLTFLFAKSATGENLVRIMTIHGAKGLEFDTVFLPQLHRGTPPIDSPLLAWAERRNSDGEQGLLMAGQPRRGESDAIYKFVKEQAQRRSKHEDGRLLYVAMTRARKELFLSGAVETKPDGTVNKPWRGTPLHHLWPLAEEIISRQVTPPSAPQPAQQMLPLTRRTETVLRRLPQQWQAPEPARAAIWIPIAKPAIASARVVSYDWAGDTARHVGNVVHEFLRRFGETGLQPWTESAIEQQRPFVEAELLRLGVPRADSDEASERVLRALRRSAASVKGQWIFAAHPEARSEWELTGFVRGSLLNATIDRTFVDEQDRRWIIDFKTSEHEGGRLTAFLDEEQRRYRDQLESYGALLRLRESRPIFLGLFFPLIDAPGGQAWREWGFEEAAAVAGG